MYNDRLHFKSKVDSINPLHLPTKQTYLEMCVGEKHTIVEKTELKCEKLWYIKIGFWVYKDTILALIQLQGNTHFSAPSQTYY